ncbi:cytochrome c peroxidase [Haloferula sp.]|uniref:YncE family protein n=1 Tax=Haloferula sp. TaxID=2497595 RepID=UPI003C722B51
MPLRLLILLALTVHCAAFEHFEARQVHPVDLTPDGTKLLALQSVPHRLSVFSTGTPLRSSPLLISEIPVSTSPVSVRARTNDEVWVVNEVSDSVSIVSLSRRLVIDTLRVADEPADVIFANGKAFVSCAQARRVFVFNAVSRNLLGEIAIDGLQPRAMSASPDGSMIYLASLDSGNQTTILPRGEAPLPPQPSNPELPDAPPTALIVAADDDRISHTVLDHDIAAIDTETLEISTWFSGIGTHLFDLATHPDGTLFCVNSESLNLTRFEPELNGHFSLHRLTHFDPSNGEIIHHDLNPGIDRATSPVPASLARALAQPTSVTLTADGQRAWITAFNSDRVAEVATSTGTILKNIDVRPSGAGTHEMRGPRAATLSIDGSRLYVLNKISDTLTTIDTSSGTILSDQPLGSADPMPANIRMGRGILYDARLSGNGTVSCATCHLDADRDGLAWDLGDPGGQMIQIPSANLSIHEFDVFNRQVHPMKGPLTTQTLKGLALNDARPNDPTTGQPRPTEAIQTKFHWRGDKPSIQSFNSTFPNLMGGVEIPEADMDLLTEYLLSIRLHPNPNRNLDRTLKTELNGANPARGLSLFTDHNLSHCIVCHDFNAGTDQNLDDHLSVGSSQPMKNPGFRMIYQRANIFDPNGVSLSGFGLGSDGSGHDLPVVHPYALDRLDRLPITAQKRQNLADIEAYLLSFDTAIAPTVGHEQTITTTNHQSTAIIDHLELLENHATAGLIGVVGWGQHDGVSKQLRFDPSTSHYVSDSREEAPLTRSELLAMIRDDDALTVSGVSLGETSSRGGDRNENGLSDRDEAQPQPIIGSDGASLYLQWGAARDWYPEAITELGAPWLPAEGEWQEEPARFEFPTDRPARQFYRLRRTW